MNSFNVLVQKLVWEKNPKSILLPLVREVRLELTMHAPKACRFPLAYTHIIGTGGQIRTDTE